MTFTINNTIHDDDADAEPICLEGWSPWMPQTLNHNPSIQAGNFTTANDQTITVTVRHSTESGVVLAVTIFCTACRPI